MTPAQQWLSLTAPDTGAEPTSDPRELPSSRSAIEFIEGKPGSLVSVALHTAARTMLIALGLYLTGARDRVLVHALGAALTIEAAAFLWVMLQKKATDTSGILDYDSKAASLFGVGYHIPLYYIDGRGWRYGRIFQGTSSDALSSMRMMSQPGEKQYMFRWIPTENRWGRVA